MIILYKVCTLLILLIGLVSSTIPRQKCKTNFFYKTLPMVRDENYIINLDRQFDGYNLTFSLKGTDGIRDLLTLNDKLHLNKRQVPQQPLTGIKNTHLQKKNNVWGQSFITLTEKGHKSFLNYGILNNNKSAPIINNVKLIEDSTDIKCYDAIIFPVKGLILVDCVKTLSNENSQGQLLKNIFYYYRIDTGEKQAPDVQSEMFVPFQNITRRRLQIYTDLASSHTFLLRTYFYDGVDQKNSGNTYIDVFEISQPHKPWIVEIIDRTFLDLTKLQIVDIKVYLDQIYVLDINNGLFRIRINFQEDLVLLGYYQCKGFSRFDVFSNNLDDSFELLLANNHALYEIDWSSIDKPRLMNKYSLMPDSNVSQVTLNSRFAIVQSKNNPVDENGTQINQFNYTWIFARGSRTYQNAFYTISHNNPNIYIDLNKQMSYLILIDQLQTINYALDSANLLISMKYDQDILDKISSFNISGKSVDKLNPAATTQCEIVINFTLLQSNNRTLWPIGLTPPSNYISNFPGKVVIPLYQYVIGPNVSYSIRNGSQEGLNESKILQYDQLKITWQKPLPTDLKPVFLKTETFNNIAYEKRIEDPGRLNAAKHQKNVGAQGQDLVIVYMQDDQNISYISYCLPKHESLDVYCNQSVTKDLQGKISFWVTGYFPSRYTFMYHHVIAYTLTKHTNIIYLVDLTSKVQLEQIKFEKGYAGLITSIQITGKYMFVSLKYIKTVKVFDLQLCLEGLCESGDDSIYEVNFLTFYDFGIKYFSPASVHTSLFHPEIIFIKSADSVTALNVDKEAHPVLLGRINPVSNAETLFHFKINAESLIVTIYPSTIIEYDISRLKYREFMRMKYVPFYGTKLTKDYVLDVSDNGNAYYVTMINDEGLYKAYVYRSGLPAVGSLLNIIELYTYNTIMLDVTGTFIDYITVVEKGQLRIYRQFELPIAQVYCTQKDFKFYLEYTNRAAPSQLQLIEVEILKLQNGISTNPILDNIMNTKDLLYSGENIVSQVDDRDWATGNILNITSVCHECSDKIKVNNHIQFEANQQVIPVLTDFSWDLRGGVLQQMNYQINLKDNSTVHHYVPLNDIQNEFCYKVASSSTSRMQVSACLHPQGTINLHVVSFASSKPYAFEPIYTQLQTVSKLEIVNDIVLVLDTDQNAFFKGKMGGILLYALDNDLNSEFPLYQIEYIDSNDLLDENDKQRGNLLDVYIVNTHLRYDKANKNYRLYITDIRQGLFVVDFNYQHGAKEITINHINYINVHNLLKQQHKQTPYDATFQAVMIIETSYDQISKQYTQKAIVTMGLYHTLQIQIRYLANGLFVSKQITRLYLRYSFYVVDNDIKYHNGMLLLRQVLPKQIDDPQYFKQMLTVYRTQGKFNGTIEQRGLLGAYLTNDSNLHSFDFNLTFNQNDGHSEPRTGLVMVQSLKDSFNRISLHKNLSVYTSESVQTQIIELYFNNDFISKRIRILINGLSDFPEWLLILIILLSIIGGILLLLLCFVLFKYIQHRRRLQNAYQDDDPSRGSLMTDNN